MIDLNDLLKPAENLVQDVKDYVDLKEDQVKIETTKVASTSIARVLAAILIINCLLGLILLLSGTIVLAVGELIGSYALGAAIVTVLYAIGMVILYLRRKKLFVNTFVKLFISLLYGDK